MRIIRNIYVLFVCLTTLMIGRDSYAQVQTSFDVDLNNVRTIDLPNDTTLNNSGFNAECAYTLASLECGDYDDKTSFQTYINDAFMLVGADFIQINVVSYPDSSEDSGLMSIVISPAGDGVNRTLEINTIGHYYRIYINSEITPSIRQIPDRKMFPHMSDAFDICVSNLVYGNSYSIWHSGEELQRLTADESGEVIYGQFWDDGDFSFYDNTAGKWLGRTLRIAYYDMFYSGGMDFSAFAPAQVSLPSLGGSVTVCAEVDSGLSEVEIEHIESMMNSVGLDGRWNSDLGWHLDLAVEDGRMLYVTVTCPPNMSSVELIQDTGFYLCEGGNTLKFVQTAQSVLDERNYILTYTAQDSLGTFTRDVVYYNGLGMQEQSIAIAAAPDGKDYITPVVYDEMGRSDAKEFLPFKSDISDGKYLSDAPGQQMSFYMREYGESENRAYISRAYEGGPSGKVISLQKPGVIYEQEGKYSQYNYRCNDSTDRVHVLEFGYSPDGNHYVTVRGVREPKSLKVNELIGEDGDTSMVFVDAFSKTICSRQRIEGINIDTYFVYDIRDSLVCVIQPEGSNRIEDSFRFNDKLAQDYCFLYDYDEWGNIISVHIPGGGSSIYAYDARGRQVLYADAMMQNAGWYKYSSYDDLDRIVEEGYCMFDDEWNTIRSYMSEGYMPDEFWIENHTTYQAGYYSELNTEIPAGLGFHKVSGVVEQADYEHCITMLSYEKIYESPVFGVGSQYLGTYYIEKAYFYDYKGRIIQVNSIDSDGWSDSYSYKYDFKGNILKEFEEHEYIDTYDRMLTENTYDSRGRILSSHIGVNNNEFSYQVNYAYDDFGRLVSKSTANLLESISYNLQGWITERAVKIGDVDVWSEELKYYEPTAQEAQPRFDGMISETKSELHLSGHSNSIYQYDKLKRIISTKSRNSSLGNFNNRESGITYDRNGNILTLERDGNYSYQYSYDGNRMICLYEEGACYEDNYIWNEAGALTERSGDLSGTTIVFVYNVAGFPRSINGKDYVYLSDGTKVKMLGADGKGLLYRGNFVYHTHPPQYGHPLLESIGHREGRFVVTGKTGDDTPDLQDLYFVRDHLGSVVSILERGDDSSFDISDIREENLYHSYGTLHRGNGIPGMSSNRYRYNGKEEQPVGTDYIDYGARLYSPGLGRWLSPDPLAEKYYNVSPYAFCNNNPVNFVDPDGRSTWVVANPDGTYTIEGGNLDDNDLNIYVVTYDEDGNMNIGESIGRTTSITSFYNYDKGKDGKVKGWMKGSVIIPSDESGMRFISTMLQKDPSLLGYIWNARNNMPYDFKVTNCMGERIDGLDPYRGMPISKDADAVIYTSARDVGNIMAGYIAGRKGLAWHIARSGFDMYQSLSEPGMGWTPEGVSTQNAQRVGWKEGFMIYYKKRLSIND